MKSLLLSVTLLGLLIANGARADEWDKTTRVTFSDPIQVPGAVLDAGTYRFKLLDSPSTRNVVQVFNADGTKLIRTILAIPNWRLQPTDKTVLLYSERPVGEPQALEAWFYPGDNSGQQFVYPKAKAEELSRLNNTTVPSEDEASNSAAPSNSESTQPATNSDTSTQPQAAAPPPEEPKQYARVEPTPAPEEQPVPQSSAPSKLPQTSSELPLVGFIGMLLLAAAVFLRFFVRLRG